MRTEIASATPRGWDRLRNVHGMRPEVALIHVLWQGTGSASCSWLRGHGACSPERLLNILDARSLDTRDIHSLEGLASQSRAEAELADPLLRKQIPQS
jgi:hypothetical protein